MKICIISPDYPSEGRPVYTFVEQLCVSLAKLGNVVYVIAPQSIINIVLGKQIKRPKCTIQEFSNGEVRVFSPYGISAYRFSFITNIVNKLYSFYLSFYFRGLKIRPDVIYCHFWRSSLCIYKEAIKQSIPLFVATGESVIKMRNCSNYIGQCCSYVKGVICVSSKNRTESIRNGLTTYEKCIVIPNGIDSALFYKQPKDACRKTLGFNKKDFIVSFVGYFGERKGSKRVSEAIRKLNNPNIKSIFIGSSIDKTHEPDCDGILFKGKLEHYQIPLYLNCADIFVLPTLQEGCCNAIIEAMACGLPVVSSDRDFNYDILDESCSILVEPLDISEISESIYLLMNSTELREKLSNGALEKSRSLSLCERAKKIQNYIENYIC